MFIDRVKLQLKAGKGGNGIIAWRREKYIPKGGPCGGDGGHGGSVVIRASRNLYALDKYRNITQISAEDGGQGGPNRRKGKNGKDRVLLVPCGTLVKDPITNMAFCDLTEDDQTLTLCHGGCGGKGNDFFKTSTNRAPNRCTQGKPGEERDIELELKLIADIGFVGMPNAGKSTLLSALTSHHVKIGDYPFTTLVPNLGYIEFPDYSRLTFADIPGLIEGAHHNRGLGFEFLKHIERTRALIIVIDLIDPISSPREAFTLLMNELNAYSPSLLNKPRLIALNKIDAENASTLAKEFKIQYPGENIVTISAKENLHLEQLTHAIQRLISPNESTPSHQN